MSAFSHSPQTSMDSARLARLNSVRHDRRESPLISLSRMDSPRLTQSFSRHGIGASSCSMDLYIIDPSPRPSHSAFAPSWSFEASVDDEHGYEYDVQRPYSPTPTNNDLVHPSLVIILLTSGWIRESFSSKQQEQVVYPVDILKLIDKFICQSPSGRSVKLDLAPPTTMEYQVTDSVDVNALQSPDGMYPENEEWGAELSPKEVVESSENLKIAAYRAEVKTGAFPMTPGGPTPCGPTPGALPLSGPTPGGPDDVDEPKENPMEKETPTKEKKKKNKKTNSQRKTTKKKTKKATKKETKKESGKKSKKKAKSKLNKKTKNEKKKEMKKDKVHKKKESEKVKRKKAKKKVKDQEAKAKPNHDEIQKIEQQERQRKMTDNLIRVFVETTARSRIRFDKISMTKPNGKTMILSSKGLTQGVHGWSIEILRADAELQEIGVVGTADIDRIPVSDDGVMNTAEFGCRSIYGSELSSGKLCYGSWNTDNKERCLRDLAPYFNLGWTVGDVISVELNLDKGRIKFLLNGEPVRYMMSLERERTYYPMICFSGNCRYFVK